MNPVYTQAYTYRAITRSRLGNYDDALQDFREAIELRPDLPGPYYSRGVTRLLNQQFTRGHRRFRQVHPSGEQGRRRLHLPRPELPAPQRHDRAPTTISTPRSAPTARIPTATTAAGGLLPAAGAVTRRPKRISTRPSSATRPTCSPTSTARWSTIDHQPPDAGACRISTR